MSFTTCGSGLGRGRWQGAAFFLFRASTVPGESRGGHFPAPVVADARSFGGALALSGASPPAAALGDTRPVQRTGTFGLVPPLA